jgi:NAD(P)-dependent dehydrogenase (short-subunit alcohol dehydrogenase family)
MLLSVSIMSGKEDMDVRRLFDQAIERFGRLDALVNNVGMNLATGVVDTEPALFNEIVESKFVDGGASAV